MSYADAACHIQSASSRGCGQSFNSLTTLTEELLRADPYPSVIQGSKKSVWQGDELDCECKLTPNLSAFQFTMQRSLNLYFFLKTSQRFLVPQKEQNRRGSICLREAVFHFFVHRHTEPDPSLCSTTSSQVALKCM